ncbi:hypothetical protein JTB14_009821 [Gonioctena quinquepunctata]|nr:hypothetical protein JTB14_009821 [Gonioctena quinquepunctata]
MPLIINIPAPVVTCNTRQIPIPDWGLKFNGSSRELYTFLDKVTEYAHARGLDNVELFEAAAELFEGDAFLWFLQVKSDSNNWDKLVSQMKSNVLPPHAEDEIWDTIMSRKQSKDETIVLLSAVMENILKRLSHSPHENTKVRIIRKNVLPDYIPYLALQYIDTVQDLITLCKRLEKANYIGNRSSNKSNNVKVPVRDILRLQQFILVLLDQIFGVIHFRIIISRILENSIKEIHLGLIPKRTKGRKLLL